MADGGGLYLEISAKGSKNWRMMYRRPSDKKEARLASRLVFGLMCCSDKKTNFIRWP